MFTINIFDALFSGQYSVMGKKPQRVEYVRGQMVFDGITLFTDAHIVQDVLVSNVQSPVKIGWLREPQCLHPGAYEAAWRNRHLFDIILTYHQPFLDQGGPFKFCPYGGVWLERQHWGVKPKTKMLSMLYGTKIATEGHKIRPKIAEYLLGMDIDVDFYGARGEAVDYSAETKRKVLQDYRFTIVTETCRDDNLFTEILLDCFAVGTVPIFWGCPNAHKYFDVEGIFQFDTARDAAIMASYLDEGMYERTLPAVFENHERMKEYEITEDWIFDRVLAQLA